MLTFRREPKGLELARLMLQLWDARVNLLVIGEKIARNRAYGARHLRYPYSPYMLYAAHEQACNDVWEAQQELARFYGLGGKHPVIELRSMRG